jgi:hypothetical protein
MLLALLVISQSLSIGGGSPVSVRQPFEVNITDKGAKCDGATDDSGAIQSAINAVAAGGLVVIPAHTCAFATTLVFGDATDGLQTTTYIGLRGAGPVASRLLWTGSTSSPAVKMVRNKYFYVADVQIANNGVRGTSIGLLEGGYGGVGTETVGGLFEHVLITGFHVDLQAGDSSNSAAASDNEYHYIELDNADTGYLQAVGNDFNHLFFDLNLGSNATGVEIGNGNFLVVGGSTFGNTTVDYNLHSNNPVTVRGIRGEVATRFITASSPLVHVVDCVLDDLTSSHQIILASTTNQLIVEGSTFNGSGQIAVTTTPPRYVRLVGNDIGGTPDAISPLTVVQAGGGGTFQVVFENNVSLTQSIIFPDTVGLYSMANPVTYFPRFLTPHPVSYSGLPTCSAISKGLPGFITDANTTTFLAQAGGGGSGAVPVICDGSNWKIGG